MKKYYYASFTYLILGMIAGIFYRELTRMSNFHGETMLKGVHTHILVLGFIFFLVVMLLDKVLEFSTIKGAKAWFISYHVTFVYLITTMIIRGISEVKGFEIVGLSHMAGLSHALFGVSLVWFMTLIGKTLR